jgi:hypothetical protein
VSVFFAKLEKISVCFGVLEPFRNEPKTKKIGVFRNKLKLKINTGGDMDMDKDMDMEMDTDTVFFVSVRHGTDMCVYMDMDMTVCFCFFFRILFGCFGFVETPKQVVSILKRNNR